MILDVQDVTVEFNSPGGVVRALDGVSLHVDKGETVGLVGESGCGKTTLARVVLGLQPYVGGSVNLSGRQVTGIPRDVAKDVGMVWQDPYASLDPRWKVSRSIVEAAELCGIEVDAKALFEEVGLSPDWMDRYPHQMSGGQRQRVAIGRAIATKPPLVICDEPTAALDLSIRAQILTMLKKIQQDLGCSYLYISHDLLTVRFLADRLAVMYLGRIVEEGPTEEVFQNPRHPYTKALMDSAPTIDRLMSLPEALEGELPDPRTRFVGCRFASRCPVRLGLEREGRVQEALVCGTQEPPANRQGTTCAYCHFPLGTQEAVVR